MIRLTTLVVITLMTAQNAIAFCGFYVAKADATLFNKTSQVIIARDGNRSTITMSSDYDGDVKDFAMVVPVPVVLDRKDIRTISSWIFKRLDDYSAPRLAEYYDPQPCPRPILKREISANADYSWFADGSNTALFYSSNANGVSVEAKYKVDEYDILILSATESSGLKRWLLENNYNIPKGAEEVLEPYIRDGMKFFVAKVNLSRLELRGSKTLNPIQVSFESPKFMLPIRLGMANAKGDQDMIVYALSKKGRVETSNYRTVKIPTNQNIPLNIQENFATFYKDVFETTYERNFGKPVFLEYAWNISGTVTTKCDPCVGPPPMYTDLKSAGASWLNFKKPNTAQSSFNYGDCFFTRLHVRYNRENFPQDLEFINTPNKEQFQGKYVIRHPSAGKFDCEKAIAYLHNLRLQRQIEVVNLAHLTGKNTVHYDSYIHEFDRFLPKEANDIMENKASFFSLEPDDSNFYNKVSAYLFYATVIALILLSLFMKSRRTKAN